MKHCKLPFGAYCEVHDEPMLTNTMVTRSTPAIVLGPTGNLQGTYKFFNLATGKKVKRRAFTPYPMPDSVIKKVEAYAKSTALPGIFDFADRNGILFKWNKEVDESPEGIIDVKDVALYPSLAAEHPGVALGRDQPLPSIEVELVPQGHAEDAAARNANIQLLNIAGVWAATPLVQANVDELDAYKSDDDVGIMAAADIPQQPPHAPLVINVPTTTTWEVMRMPTIQKPKTKTMQRATTTSRLTWRQPLTWTAMNQAKIKECEDRGAEERASPRSTPITVY